MEQRDNRRMAHKLRDPDLGILLSYWLDAFRAAVFDGLHEAGYADLRPAHGSVLAYVDAHGVRATTLAQLSGRTKQAVGLVVDELERLGYVERRTDPEDHRAKLIVATPRGMAAALTGDQLGRQVEDRLGQQVGESQYAALRRALLVLWSTDTPNLDLPELRGDADVEPPNSGPGATR